MLTGIHGDDWTDASVLLTVPQKSALIDSLGAHPNPVVDPGFPRQGCQTLILDQKPIIWQDFC